MIRIEYVTTHRRYPWPSALVFVWVIAFHVRE